MSRSLLPSSIDAGRDVNVNANNAASIPNFRSSEHYNLAVAGAQNSVPEPPFIAPPAPMIGAASTNTSGPYYAGLPGPQPSQLPPIASTVNQNVPMPGGQMALLDDRQRGHVPSTSTISNQRRQNSEAGPQDKHSQSSGRTMKQLDDLEAKFAYWLSEYDQRSLDRYDATRKKYNELHDDHVALKAETVKHTEIQPRLDKICQGLGQCYEGTRQAYERGTKLEEKFRTEKEECAELSSRVSNCQTGFTHMGQRMRQFEDDRREFVSQDTLDALEISHARAAEARLGGVEERLQADLKERTAAIEHIGGDMKALDERTSKLGTCACQEGMEARMSSIEEQVSELEWRRQDRPKDPDALARITTLESQMTTFNNELKNSKITHSRLDTFGDQIKQIQGALRHLAQGVNGAPSVEAQALKSIIETLCQKIKQYTSSSAQDLILETVFTAFISNPAFVTRMQSNEHLHSPQPHSDHSVDSSQQTGAATSRDDPKTPSTSNKLSNGASGSSRRDEDPAGTENCAKSWDHVLYTPKGKAKNKQRRPRVVHESDSENEITAKKLKAMPQPRSWRGTTLTEDCS